MLLDENFNAKLCDFGLVKLGPGKPGHLSAKVVGTYGYCAPEYASSGELTTKSDVYSFGVVFLEIITGRRAIDGARPYEEHNLVTWVRRRQLLEKYDDCETASLFSNKMLGFETLNR